MSVVTLQQEVSKIKKWIRRRRILSVIKYSVYFILLLGVIGHLIAIYEDSQLLQVSVSRTSAFERMGFMAYRITIFTSIYNPTRTVFELKNLYAKIYVNGYFLSELQPKPYLIIRPGENQETFQLELNLRDLPQIVKETVANDGVIRVRIDGSATIPLKAFGVVPWHEVTIPLSILPEQTFQIQSDDRSAISTIARFDITSYINYLNSISNYLDSIGLDIKTLRDRVNSLENLGTRITNIEGDLNRLSSKIDSLRNELLAMIPEVYQARIFWVDYDREVRRGEASTVKVWVEYTFSKPTVLTVYFWDPITLQFIASHRSTFQGSGIETITLSITAPLASGLWQPTVVLYYVRQGQSILASSQDLIIFVR